MNLPEFKFLLTLGVDVFSFHKGILKAWAFALETYIVIKSIECRRKLYRKSCINHGLTRAFCRLFGLDLLVFGFFNMSCFCLLSTKKHSVIVDLLVDMFRFTKHGKHSIIISWFIKETYFGLLSTRQHDLLSTGKHSLIVFCLLSTKTT